MTGEERMREEMDGWVGRNSGIRRRFYGPCACTTMRMRTKVRG